MRRVDVENEVKKAKRINFFVTAFLALVVAASAEADDKAVQKYRNYIPQQIKDMPEKLRSSELPMMYIFAAQRGLAIDSELLFAMQLNHLMYPGINDYKSAVKSFQADLGDQPTGTLTVWQIHQLEYRSDLQKLTAVSFPDSFSSFKTDDYGSVEGTVTILDDRAAWPINHHKINCFRSEKSCEVRQVMLALPDDKSWVQRFQVMIDEVEYYKITRWTKDVIDAEYPSKPDNCRTTSLTLNFKTKEFFFITKNAGGKCEFMGAKLEKLAKPRISQVVEGKKIINEEFARIARVAYGALASDFRKKIEKAAAQVQKAK